MDGAFWHNPSRMILRDARPDEIDLILAHTHALWADGLELDSYREYIRTLMQSHWARRGDRRYRFMVLADEAGAGVVGGMKLYRFAARLDEDPLFCGGIGAVFTLRQHRGRGHAAQMIRRAHEIMAQRGDSLSLLFSEIGSVYYARLGYRVLPSHAVRIEVPAGAGAPSAAAGKPAEAPRRMHRGELDTVIRIREKEDSSSAFALTRDRDYWQHLLARASYPTLWLGAEAWESRLMLLGTGEQAGYLWACFGSEHSGSGGRILEMGEMQPGTALPALLDDLFQECRRRGVSAVEAWIPSAIATRDPRLAPPAATSVEPPQVVPMWLPFDAEAAFDLGRHEQAARFHLSDLF